MKYRKQWILSALIVLLGLLAAGCGKKATAESLFLNAAKEIKNARSVDLDILFELEQGSGQTTILGKTEVSLDANVKTEPKKGACVDGEAKLGVLGQEASLPVKSYLVSGEEKNTLYLYNPITGSWSVTEDSEKKETDFVLGSIRDYLKLCRNMTLSEKTPEYQGRECYKVTGEIKGSDLSGLIDQLGETLQEYSLDTDSIKDLKAKAEFYFDKEKKSLAGAVFEFDESDASLEIRINSYDDYEFTLPKEVADASVKKESREESGPDAANGIFAIEGRTYRLFDTADALEESGWKPDEKADNPLKIPAEGFEKFVYEKDGRNLTILFWNDSGEEKPARECKITGVWDTSKNDSIVELDDGTKVGSDYQKVIDTFGEPEDVFLDEEHRQEDAKSLDYMFGKVNLSVYMTNSQVSGLYLGIIWQ